MLFRSEAERIGTDAFLERWLAQPLFARVPADAPGLAERRQWRAADLATMLRTLGTGEMEPLWGRLAELTMPVMIVTGTHDAKFDALGDQLAAGIEHAHRVRIDGGAPYYESIDLVDAFHPQTILAWAMNDRFLDVGHGAPLRLRVERQLGYKQAKYLMRMRAVDSLVGVGKGRGGYWEDNVDYDWWAGI